MIQAPAAAFTSGRIHRLLRLALKTTAKGGAIKQNRVWTCLVVAAVVSASFSVRARRLYESEYYMSGNGVDGSVLYPCEGGQVSSGWMASSELGPKAWRCSTMRSQCGCSADHPKWSPAAMCDPLGSGQHCAKTFDWNNAPTDFADAVSQCSWVQ